MTNENTYWANKGTHQAIIKKLEALIPDSGPVVQPYKNKALERFRKASNAYYRLYNDGDFNSGKGRMFGIEQISRFSKREYYTQPNGRLKSYGGWKQGLYDEVEKGMDRIIVAACIEQGIALN